MAKKVKAHVVHREPVCPRCLNEVPGRPSRNDSPGPFTSELCAACVEATTCGAVSKDGLRCDHHKGHEDDHRNVTRTAYSTTTIRWHNAGPQVKDVLAALDVATKGRA